jgi:hypothetical protein
VKVGVLVAILGLLETLNGLPLANRGYDTSMPLAVWKLQLAVGATVVPLLEGLLAWLLIGSAASLYPDAWKIFSASARRVWRRDALVALVLSLAAGAGLARVNAFLISVFHAYTPIREELFSPTFSTPWPAAGIFFSVMTRTLLYAAMVGLVFFIIHAGWRLRAWWLWMGLALVLVSLGPTHAHTFPEFGVGWVMNLLPLLVTAGVAGFFLRDNILAYVMVLFCSQVAESLMDLFSQHNTFFLQNGVALALLAGTVLVWMLSPFRGVEGTNLN